MICMQDNNFNKIDNRERNMLVSLSNLNAALRYLKRLRYLNFGDTRKHIHEMCLIILMYIVSIVQHSLNYIAKIKII